MDGIVFLDANILVYAANKDSPYHADAKRVIEQINAGEIASCLSSQVLAEFYATVTSPKKMSQPLNSREAAEAVEGYLESHITKFYIRENTMMLALELTKRYRIRGLGFFDAQIVATMLENGVRTIYTANEEDFRRFEEIEVVNPLK